MKTDSAELYTRRLPCCQRGRGRHVPPLVPLVPLVSMSPMAPMVQMSLADVIRVGGGRKGGTGCVDGTQRAGSHWDVSHRAAPQ